MTKPLPPDCCVPPTDNVMLWRYMDLSKFVSLLQTKQIFFPRADHLGDPFEGSVGALNANEADRILAFRQQYPDLEGWRQVPDDTIRELFKLRADHRRTVIKQVYVSCWHMNEHESAGMWRLYSQSSEAICVQTRYELLREQLPEWVYPSMVNYVNYDEHYMSTANVITPFIHKRASFSHERELRFIVWPARVDGKLVTDIRDEGPPVVQVKVDISKVVESIRVSPTAPEWFRNVVQGLVEIYQLPVEVQQSSLSASPLY